MKTLLLAGLLALCACNVPRERHAEHHEPDAPTGTYGSFFSPWERVPGGPEASPGAVVSQVIGADTWVRIAWHRPGVRGRDVWTAVSPRNGAPVVPREGVPVPWRAGANEPTTLEVSRDVLFEGKPLPAGKYVLLMIPREHHWTLVVQRFEGNGGAGRFDPELTVLQANVEPREAPHREWLAYGFDELGPDAATAWLHWADVMVPFRIALPG